MGSLVSSFNAKSKDEPKNFPNKCQLYLLVYMINFITCSEPENGSYKVLYKKERLLLKRSLLKRSIKLISRFLEGFSRP